MKPTLVSSFSWCGALAACIFGSLPAGAQQPAPSQSLAPAQEPAQVQSPAKVQEPEPGQTRQPIDPRADPTRYDLVWNTPGPDHSASVPLGNGSTGVNAWVEPDGSLVFYISRGDSWSENGRLLKIGRVRVNFDPPLDTSARFEQNLHLVSGVLAWRSGKGDDLLWVKMRVDAHHPRIEIESIGAIPRSARAVIEMWRTEPTRYPEAEVSDLLEDRSKPNRLHQEVMVSPDTLLGGNGNFIGWYHHNDTSVGPDLIAELQGLEGILSERPDPLLHRTFGALITATDGRRVNASTLSVEPRKKHSFSVTVHSAAATQPKEWTRQIMAAAALAETQSPAQRGKAHAVWWKQFWERSWIHVTGPPSAGPVPLNDHTARIGVDQNGGNEFRGELGTVSIHSHALSSSTIGEIFDHERRHVEPQPWLQIPRDLDWSFPNGFTVEAWVKAGDLPAGGGRILDKVTPGVSDGLLFDTYPGRGLRLIAGPLTLTCADVLPLDQWVHVAGVLDPVGGHAALFLNGELIASTPYEFLDDAAVVSRAYALQRYVNACAGRGAYPIKFNGSIFTVPAEGKFGDADYRRWGPGYWWQNTRLPYLSMCASGDFEMMKPLFRMYADELMPVHRYRTRQYTGHDGAFLPECIYFWGPTFTATYGWTPYAERGADKLQESGWHKREWVSGLELVWMMLNYYEHTLEADFLRDTLLPTAHEILTFFDQHYADGPDGRMLMEPSMALETWWDTTNPMPELAGLHAVTTSLLALPASKAPADARAFWLRLQARLPELPLREVDGVKMLAPAQRFENKSNVENPELYAVFPFQLVSAVRGNQALGIAALDARWDRGNSGWRQDDLFMTHLGLAEQARKNLVARARNKHAGSRFPAFWGPNYDWIPDQDHGGVLLRTLQTMLMQTDGDKIHMLPAWPRDWDADFKLHAPGHTTINGYVREAAIVQITVVPNDSTRRISSGFDNPQ